MENRALYGIGLFASLAALAFGCSADSATPVGGTGGSPPNTGGTTTTATGGTTFGTGGTTTTATGGTTTTATGGTTTTATGGTTTTATGGTTTTTTGGTTTTTTGGTTTTTTGGSGGANGGMAGATATGGTSTAGATGTGGAATGTGCSNGCAELKVPFTAFKSAQAFEIYLAAPVDFSTGVVSVKLRTTAGKAGGIQVVLKNPEANMYAWAQTAWLGIADTVKADWTTVTLDASAPPSMDATNVFDKTKVSIIAIQIAAGDPWYTDTTNTTVDQAALVNPTIVQVDEISVAGATGVGPYTFAANVTDLKLGAYMPVANAAVTWLPPL